MRLFSSLFALGLFVNTACEPARRYGDSAAPPRPESSVEPIKQAAARPGLNPETTWREPTSHEMDPDVPIQFVVARGPSAAEWDGLKHFWNEVPMLPLNPSPLSAAALAVVPSQRVVKIKVPLGLDDPSTHIPSANPPTVGKWELGKRLFFDDSYLLPAGKTKRSCAGCHVPDKGYTDGRVTSRGYTTDSFFAIGEYNTPTLINSVYNRHQFWDGRAVYLEEVIQRTREDEEDTDHGVAGRPHVWPGVVKRLLENPDYDRRFRKVFGTPPTQDAVGKALATYLRTILSGNSIQDRAEKALKESGADTLGPAHYEKVLDTNTLETLNRLLDRQNIGAPKLASALDASREVHRGYLLFAGRSRCMRCHGGAEYTDHGFHNLNVRESMYRPEPGKEVGRFALVPAGLKDPRLIGAFKTPTLRALPRTGPYLHDGAWDHLFEAIGAVHVRHGTVNPYVDPELRDLHLKEEEVRDLVLFLLTLDGDAVDPVVANPTK